MLFNVDLIAPEPRCRTRSDQLSQGIPGLSDAPRGALSQWWMLLVAILAILSNQGSLLGMERFAKRHREVDWFFWTGPIVNL